MSSHHVDDLLKLHTVRGIRAYAAWIIAAVSSNTKHTFLRELRRLSNDKRLEVLRGSERAARNVRTTTESMVNSSVRSNEGVFISRDARSNGCHGDSVNGVKNRSRIDPKDRIGTVLLV